ncbi:XRE family transcriptional regulator [Sphaerisporangium album]|uniref:XRE family transcriptional regulator n=2 Tax=Sphaerisporangium album TaxID=509200 RepID=A0A367FPR1_9ACTN|nr:XRE family transcriptional regulator [Sphaerisporangium album]
MRQDAGLTGRELAMRAGWRPPKVSKLEHGQQNPSEDDIRTWCRVCDAEDQIPELIATVRAIEAQYLEWRRQMRGGQRRVQSVLRTEDLSTRLYRIFEPFHIPGFLQTREYARVIMARSAQFYDAPNDLEAAVAARLGRQTILRMGDRRFHIVVAEQALYTRVGGSEVMHGQLVHLLNEIAALSRLRFGVVPRPADYELGPHAGYWIFDARLVMTETVTAGLNITQPREVAMYERHFDGIAELAVYGQAAVDLIRTATEDL